MAYTVETEIIIHASTDKIWQIFTDFDNYPNWNPFIKYIKGQVAVGNKIQVGITGMTFKPVVLKYQDKKELCWVGHLIIPGIFDGQHQFSLEALLNGSVRFKQGETFSGILVPLFKGQLKTKIKSGFEAMNLKLKELAEES